MTSLPIPFVVALLLVLLLAINYQPMKETSTGRLFAVVLAIYALSMILIGLRWSHGMVRLLPMVATLAIASSALLYLAFRSLGRQGPAVVPARDWIHLLPVLAVATGALVFGLRWLDVLVIAAKLLYALLLIRLARQAPESLQLVRLSWLKDSHVMLWGTAILLLFSILLDILITIDFARFGGIYSADLVGYASLLNLLLLAWAAVRAGQGRVVDLAQKPASDTRGSAATVEDSKAPELKSKEGASDPQDADDTALMATLDKLLREQGLYADTELNLQRLARKAGVPTRTISRTINTHTGQNMSQWVNSARIDAACALLTDPGISIGDVMNESGFLTKSNFNREFRRIKGCSPSEWREVIREKS